MDVGELSPTPPNKLQIPALLYRGVTKKKKKKKMGRLLPHKRTASLVKIWLAITDTPNKLQIPVLTDEEEEEYGHLLPHKRTASLVNADFKCMDASIHFI